MSDPGSAEVLFGDKRRQQDIRYHTILAVTIIAASTFLAYTDHLSSEATVAAWGLAVATAGTPIVIRRGELPRPVQ